MQGSPRGEAPRIRIALVLSAGGLRGAAHVGVFRRLVEEGIPIDAIVGVSAGAVIAAYYAAVGLDFDTLIGDAMAFRGRHLLTHSLGVRLGRRFEHRVERWCGVIPSRLRELDAASFDQLHHGIERLGIVCHDVLSGRPHYSSSGSDQRITLGDAVRASASIPVLFPKVDVRCGERALKLTDGGLSDPVPVAFARSPEIGATHIIVSDCRWVGRIPSVDDTTVWIRPRMFRTGSLWSPRHGLLSSVRAGELAVTAPILEKIRSWMDRSA